MISIFTLLIKLDIKKELDLQNTALCTNKSFPDSKEDYCRCCGRKKLKKVDKYTRSVTDLVNGKPKDITIESCQYKCECGKTHVLLPAFIIPYCMYSLPFILHVLFDYYMRPMSVVKICEKYNITAPTLYRWKKMFEKDKQLWLKKLKDQETAALQFLKDLQSDLHIIEKLHNFAKDVSPHRLFLQGHQFANSHKYI